MGAYYGFTQCITSAENENLPLGQGTIDFCYEIQQPQVVDVPPQTTEILLNPTITVEGNEASGSYTLKVCTYLYILQTWVLVLPDSPQEISKPFDSYFVEQYMQCSVNQIEAYFRNLEDTAGCILLDAHIEGLLYALPPNGSFTIQSSQGFLPSQQNSTSFDEAIQGCYEQSYEKYQTRAKHVRISIVAAGAVAGAALLCLGYKLISNSNTVKIFAVRARVNEWGVKLLREPAQSPPHEEL